jgi:flagellar hook-associated protein 2
LSNYLGFITEPGTGTVNSSQDALQTQIDDIGKDIADMQTRATAKQEQLQAQFAAMESALSQLQSQGSFLTSQLAQLGNGWQQQ